MERSGNGAGRKSFCEIFIGTGYPCPCIGLQSLCFWSVKEWQPDPLYCHPGKAWESVGGSCPGNKRCRDAGCCGYDPVKDGVLSKKQVERQRSGIHRQDKDLAEKWGKIMAEYNPWWWGSGRKAFQSCAGRSCSGREPVPGAYQSQWGSDSGKILWGPDISVVSGRQETVWSKLPELRTGICYGKPFDGCRVCSVCFCQKSGRNRENVPCPCLCPGADSRSEYLPKHTLYPVQCTVWQWGTGSPAGNRVGEDVSFGTSCHGQSWTPCRTSVS